MGLIHTGALSDTIITGIIGIDLTNTINGVTITHTILEGVDLT